MFPTVGLIDQLTVTPVDPVAMALGRPLTMNCCVCEAAKLICFGFTPVIGGGAGVTLFRFDTVGTRLMAALAVLEGSTRIGAMTVTVWADNTADGAAYTP